MKFRCGGPYIQLCPEVPCVWCLGLYRAGCYLTSQVFGEGHIYLVKEGQGGVKSHIDNKVVVQRRKRVVICQCMEESHWEEGNFSSLRWGSQTLSRICYVTLEFSVAGSRLVCEKTYQKTANTLQNILLYHFTEQTLDGAFQGSCQVLHCYGCILSPSRLQ